MTDLPKNINELQKYKDAWEELNRVLAPFRTDGAPHHCGIDHEEEVDVLDCISERFGLND